MEIWNSRVYKVVFPPSPANCYCTARSAYICCLDLTTKSKFGVRSNQYGRPQTENVNLLPEATSFCPKSLFCPLRFRCLGRENNGGAATKKRKEGRKAGSGDLKRRTTDR